MFLRVLMTWPKVLPADACFFSPHAGIADLGENASLSVAANSPRPFVLEPLTGRPMSSGFDFSTARQ